MRLVSFLPVRAWLSGAHLVPRLRTCPRGCTPPLLLQHGCTGQQRDLFQNKQCDSREAPEGDPAPEEAHAADSSSCDSCGKTDCSCRTGSLPTVRSLWWVPYMLWETLWLMNSPLWVFWKINSKGRRCVRNMGACFFRRLKLWWIKITP